MLIFRPSSQGPNAFFWSKSHPRRLETLHYFHLYVKGLWKHTINFEGQDKRPSLHFIQASGISSIVQNSSSNLVSSAGGNVDLGHGIGPSGGGHVGQHGDALGLSSSREQCYLPVGPGNTLRHCLSGSRAHSINGGFLWTTHQPADCTTYQKVRQQGSLVGTSPCNYVGAHVWLQEECKGEPLRQCLS